MAGTCKECRFPSHFDMPRPITPCETELPRKTELQPIKSPNGLAYPRVEVEQQTQSGTRLYHGTGCLKNCSTFDKILKNKDNMNRLKERKPCS